MDALVAVAAGEKKNEQSELLAVAQDIQSITTELVSSLTAFDSLGVATADVAALRQFAVTSQTLAGSLVDLLNKINVPNPDNKILIKVRDVIRVMQKKGQVDVLEQRLSRLCAQIILHIHLAVVPALSSSIQSMKDDYDTAFAAILFRLDGLSRNAAAQTVAPLVDQPILNGTLDALREIATGLEKLNQARQQRSVLQSLSFVQMDSRKCTIVESHEATLEWVWELYEKWLGDGVFWVKGKFGSGKSLLMKFLAEHTKTEQYFRRWARENNILIVAHYFDYQGNAIGRSQEGLPPTVLFQILQKRPELIPTICANRLQSDPHGVTTWTLHELSECFLNIEKIPDLPICIFIDSLDEYDNSLSDLLRLVLKLSQSPAIKLCVSSRQLNECEKAFRNSSSICVQDHTHRDIARYVKDNLTQDFEPLEHEDPSGFVSTLVK
ncbi:hypothetical protein BU16DRAFT_554206 [Lophium mytilinum]|uniref:Nephrocystin 3-like N-terminal domain-containing protein n=1 Tax=Lophium mytilinum TaxID=390894 RepID=A0A6A6RCL7_9PEZI|nr:hypothetical protein BU16DRAFT_554206 [Lophium mytilinum]